MMQEQRDSMCKKTQYIIVIHVYPPVGGNLDYYSAAGLSFHKILNK